MSRPAESSSVGVPTAGDQIGAYKLVEPLGRGGVALVFRAVHETTGRVVALKTVRMASEGFLASVRREIDALGRLRHPGVVNILDGGVFEGRPWYTMELLRGGTLREHYVTRLHSRVSETTERSGSEYAAETLESGSRSGDRRGPVLAASALGSSPVAGRRLVFGPDSLWLLGVIRRLCEPLAYIHGEGFVHRDLKPSNVFVRTDATPVLMDFGLVWMLQEEGGRAVLSIDAARGGTIVYMAPEQARGEKMDARGDLFSLGCMLYEAITGELPFPAQTRRDLVAAHGRAVVSPSQVAEGVPAELDALVMGLLQPQPRDRIGHANDVAAVLANITGAHDAPSSGPKAKAYLYRPEIVGRGAAIDGVVGKLAGLSAGHGALALVSGESGIGKTSFVAEVARRADAGGIRVVTSECTAVGVAAGRGVRQGGPLYPLARLLHAVGERCVAGGASATAALLGERAKILAATEPSLRHLPGIEALPEPAEVPGEAARRRLIDAMAETLSVFGADRPTLVVVDDLQWADDLTLAFLAGLSERYFQQNPVFILGTYRSEEVTTELEQIAAPPWVETLRLDRLDAAAIGTMSAEMLGLRRASQTLTAFLTAESSGNPFFVAEYLRAAVDASLLFRDASGRWQQAGGEIVPDRLGLPGNLQALVTRRLESLTEPARRLAEVAAVLGREIETEVLGALAVEVGAVADESGFDGALRDLLVRQVLETTGGISVRFVHDKLREITYEGLPESRQRVLHGAAARLLEQRSQQQGTLDAAVAGLALHFEKAGDLQKALACFDRAAEAAHRMHANLEAFRLLERARALEAAVPMPTPPLQRARRERMFGLNALALGNVHQALGSLMEAAAIANRPWPSRRPEIFLRCLQAFGGEVVRRWLPRLADAPKAVGAERELLLEAARAYERLTVVNYMATGDLLAVVLASSVNIDLAERAGGASSERALGYAAFASMCSLVPLDGVARAYGSRAVRVASEAGDTGTQSWVLVNMGLVHLQAGRWTENADSLEEARDISRKMGFSRRWEEATSQLSTAFMLRGDYHKAESLTDELIASIERADPQSKCWAIVRQAELALIRGDTAAAVELAREGERFCQNGLGFAEWIYTLGPLALATLRAGDALAARTAADLGASWAAKGSAPIFYNVYALAAIAEVYLALWAASAGPERTKLEQASRRAVKRLQLLGRSISIAAPRAFLWRGIAAAKLDRKPARAARLIKKSIEAARRLSMPYDEAMALATMGEQTTERADRDRLLDEAARILERIGATHDLAHLAERQSAARG
jgi:serine/threonine protein kinase/predicted ATPase